MLPYFYYKFLPKKHASAGLIIFNQSNELLIVKPVYKKEWSIPGGVINKNEFPKEACVREVKEEIGIEVLDIRLLCIDHAYKKGFKGDSFQFVFCGEVLTDNQIRKIKLDKNELSDYKFLKIDKALFLLSRKLQKRIPKCLDALKNNSVVYLEGGCL